MPDENSNPQPETQDSDITAMFRGFSDAIMEQVEAKLSAIQTPPTQSDIKPNSTLSQRIAELEKQLAEKAEAEKRTARQQSYDNALKGSLSQYQLAFPTETVDIVKGLMATKVDEVEGNWLSKDGKTLGEHVEAFFNTPFGQHLLAAPGSQTGSGTQPANNPRHQPTPDVNTAIGRLFGLR